MLMLPERIEYLDVGRDGAIYVDQRERPVDVLRVSADGRAIARLKRLCRRAAPWGCRCRMDACWSRREAVAAIAEQRRGPSASRFMAGVACFGCGTLLMTLNARGHRHVIDLLCGSHLLHRAVTGVTRGAFG